MIKSNEKVTSIIRKGSLSSVMREYGKRISEFHVKTNIYFLVNELDDVVYIGQSMNMHGRLTHHNRFKAGSFCKVYVLDVPLELQDHINCIESAFIKKYQPSLNINEINEPLYPREKRMLAELMRLGKLYG